MATHDYVIDNSTGANVRADINNVLQAILTNNSSSSAPSTTAAYMWWADTTSGTLKIRNSSDNAWVELLQLDGTLTLEDGSASTPALAFRDDLDTGIFSSAANSFNIATAGVERIEFGTTECVVNDGGADVDFRVEGDTNANLFKVDAGNDRVGIGLASPTAPFHVYNAGSNTLATLESGDATARLQLKDNSGEVFVAAKGNALTFANTSSMTERMRIDSSGRLLIGITSARGNFGNNTSGVEQQIQLEGTSSITSSMSLIRNSNDANDGGFIVGKTRGTSVGSNTVVQAGDDLGNIAFAGADGTSMLFGAEIKATVESGVGNDDMPAALVFSTNGGSTSTSERMRIDSSGHVTIGTNNNDPAQLELRYSTVPTYLTSTFDGTVGEGTLSINVPRISDGSGSWGSHSNTGYGSSAIQVLSHSSTGGYVAFLTGSADNTNPTEKVRINNSGQLLINKTTDRDQYYGGTLTGKLQVEGTDNDSRLTQLIHNQAAQNQHILVLGKSRGSSVGDYTLVQNGDYLGTLSFQGADGDAMIEGARIDVRVDGTAGDQNMPGKISFATTKSGNSSTTDRFRIDDEGIHSICSENHALGVSTTASSGTSKYNFRGHHSGTAGSPASGTLSFTVWSNGNVENLNNSYGQVSDETLKQDIVDASSQWNDIKNITVRKFRFKDNPTGELQIGVVAQEVEKVSAGLVYEAGDVGEEVKAVKYSVLYMKAIKCLQEAMAKIEVLETKVAALEAA